MQSSRLKFMNIKHLCSHIHQIIYSKLYNSTLIQKIKIPQDFEHTAMNLRVPENMGKLLCSGATGGFSRMTQLHGIS
jgi:hypothetical protein